MSAHAAAFAVDLFTVRLMTLVNLFIVSILALFAWRLNRSVGGMRSFALGVLGLWAGQSISFLRVLIPGNAVIAFSNIVMFVSTTVIVQGIREFRGFRPVSKKAIAAIATPTAVLYCYWMFIHDSYGMRVAVVGPAYVLLSIDAAASMVRCVPRRDRIVYWPVALAFSLSGVALAARMFGALRGWYGPDSLSQVPIEIVASLLSNISYVSYAFGILMAANAELRRETEKLALFDPLTNLPNRRLFFDRLLAAERKAVSKRERLALIYLDLDGFKEINDTLGHEAGDDLLRRASVAMSAVLNESDCLARIGGDEFVVLREGITERDGVSSLADRLKQAVEREGPIRISCGAAIFPDAGKTAHDALREADAAMYRAKRQSRPPETASSLGAERGNAYLPV